MDKLVSSYLQAENISEEAYYIGMLEGSECNTMKSFLKQIGKTFKFPSYYGKNLNALNDCLNDLEWINKPNYILIITHSNKFLIDESEENKHHIIKFLEEIPESWANVPNYEGEKEFRKKSDFKIKYL